MSFQEVFIDLIYFWLAGIGDLALLLAGGLVMAAIVDSLVIAVLIIRRAS
jgi:hypothetical protein